MHKLRETRETISEAENLIRSLWKELQDTRYLLMRMITKHGTTAQGGHINVPEEYAFDAKNITDYLVEIQYVDLRDVGLARGCLADRYHELMEDK